MHPLSDYTLFSKSWCRNLLEKNVEYESMLYHSNYRWTGHPEMFKIKLDYFQERLSLRFKIILKVLSRFRKCF